MAIVTVFSADFCHAQEVTQRVAERLGAEILTTQKLVSEVSAHFGLAEEKLLRTMHGPRSVFDRLTREKERNIAYLRFTLATLIKNDGVVYHGFAGHLLPRELTHVLRVGLAAKMDYRVSEAMRLEGIQSKEASRRISKEEEAQRQWTLHLLGLGPWDKSLYDVFLPMDSTSVDQAVQTICENAAKPPVMTTPAAQRAMNGFLLACRVNLALVEKGYDVEVSGIDDEVTITINRYVMRLEHFQKELAKVAKTVPGVKNVKTKVGPHFSQPDIYPKIDLPKKVLLVDDEKEFVHTLSERLQTRDLESTIAYDGEQALAIMESDASEVMVLDLKMPGIDGLEVLRRVKREHPHTEVIILTGHGSEAEKKLAEELGAFAYLHKPVDVDLLANTMKEAYRKIAESKEGRNQEGGAKS